MPQSPATRHRTLVLSGSLREGAVTTQVAHAAVAQDHPGHEVVLAAVLDQLPLFNEDLDTEPAPPAVAALRAQVSSAASLLVLSPVNNASISAALKNALDWLSRPRDDSPLAGKPATGLVIGYHSHGAEAHLETILRATGARTTAAPTPVLNPRAVTGNRTVQDLKVTTAVAQALATLHAPDPATPA
ncbi:NADPH-dependent FMN reductase [Streptomyces sp. N50]|uniref:NADPH-dependent FMN reductase n=1 Tax=Streptomyces sp. N50 TaxID=3081765 RepID=UPI00296200C2|nr:NADPH-dependent FMN reductase [Streptomyces sp. N50]WOX10170.1 NADPH-dependent FMN reductase [Streptomyces sp. N50]